MTATGTLVRAVLVQENSLRRTQLVEALQRDGDIRVGTVSSATEAISLVAADRPDIVIIDLTLTDGGSRYAVEQIMARTPTPILLILGRLDDRHSPRAVEALVAGALDAIAPPTPGNARVESELRHQVRQLRRVTVIRHPRGGRAATPPPRPVRGGRPPVVAIGASTGGPSAVSTVLSGLAGLEAPVLVVQHLHPDFTSGLLDLLGRASPLPVRMAEHGRLLSPGTVYLAPGHLHLKLGAGLRIELDPLPLGLHRPAVDQLFSSLAGHAGSGGVGVLLTGMGEDGARGLLDLHRAGGRTLAQDRATSAVFGMPQAAARLGAVTDLLPLGQLAAAILRAVHAVPA